MAAHLLNMSPYPYLISVESPATLAGRSRLFGKALAPSLGDAVRQPSTKATVTGRTGLFRGVGRGATSSSGRGKSVFCIRLNQLLLC